MDPVTHTLAGMTLSNFVSSRKSLLWIVIISSVLPDIDYVTRLWGTDVFLRYHRGITHGIAALFIAPVSLAVIFRLVYGSGFPSYFTFSFMGYGIHIFMDLANQYGTRVLAPFEWNRYSLDLVSFIDPYVTLTLLGAVIMTKVFNKRPFLISLVICIFLSGYVACKYALKMNAAAFLRKNIDERTVKIFPLPNDFLRWWFVARTSDRIRTGFVDLFTRRVYIQDEYVYSDYDPAVALSKEDGVVKNFLYFAEFPYPSVYSKDRYTLVEWRELSYAYIPGRHFAATILFDEETHIIGSSFKF